MSTSRNPSISSRFTYGALGLTVSLLALIPWWRNHAFLRDFYDYGLFINVNARLAQGQLPYADFTTPAQSATFILNYLSESISGGTYLGLTFGAAALIVVMGTGLTWILARKFNPWIAALLALAIVSGSASQHTIIFYNPLGVLATALVVWSFAVAPLLRRETWAWHFLAAAGLLLGGTNKINFHLLACAMAGGWVVHAWITQKPATSRALLTVAFILIFGFILPVGIELAWTGAGWQSWFYNVVQLPLSARGGRFSSLFSIELYTRTLHIYYGTLRVPPVGLIGVLMPLIAIAAAWRQRTTPASPILRAILLVGAGLLAAFACPALLLTNNEIAYVTLAAALVVSIGLWLGFDLKPRGAWFVAGVVLPAVILAAAGWESAWQGQRSQFGHDQAPRANYLPGDHAGAEFRYIHGLQIPPSLAHALRKLAQWRSEIAPVDTTRIFYGPGVEWLEHVWPVKKVAGLPLVATAFDGQRENELLMREVIAGDTFRHLVALEAWDHWNKDVADHLALTTMKQRLGNSLIVYQKFKPGTLSARPLDFRFGPMDTNVDGTRIITSQSAHTLTDGRRYLGIESGDGRIDVDTPCSRISAEYVLARTSRKHAGAVTVSLGIHANLSGSLLPRWNAEITLPEGVDELVVRTDQIDGSGLPITFTTTISPSAAGLVRAGWRGFSLADSSDREGQPPTLQPGVEPLGPLPERARSVVVPPSLGNAPLYIRRAVVSDDLLVLPAGGELWIKLEGMYSELKITTRLRVPEIGSTPWVQTVFYKGGRLETFAPSADPQTSTANFTAWSPENGGWLGILVNPDVSAPTITVKIDTAVRK